MPGHRGLNRGLTSSCPLPSQVRRRAFLRMLVPPGLGFGRNALLCAVLGMTARIGSNDVPTAPTPLVDWVKGLNQSYFVAQQAHGAQYMYLEAIALALAVGECSPGYTALMWSTTGLHSARSSGRCIAAFLRLDNVLDDSPFCKAAKMTSAKLLALGRALILFDKMHRRMVHLEGAADGKPARIKWLSGDDPAKVLPDTRSVIATPKRYTFNFTKNVMLCGEHFQCRGFSTRLETEGNQFEALASNLELLCMLHEIAKRKPMPGYTRNQQLRSFRILQPVQYAEISGDKSLEATAAQRAKKRAAKDIAEAAEAAKPVDAPAAAANAAKPVDATAAAANAAKPVDATAAPGGTAQALPLIAVAEQGFVGSAGGESSSHKRSRQDDKASQQPVPQPVGVTPPAGVTAAPALRRSARKKPEVPTADTAAPEDFAGRGTAASSSPPASTSAGLLIHQRALSRFRWLPVNPGCD